MRNQIILIIMAFVLGFSGITFIFSKFRIGNPITKLSRLSENIVAGNLDYDINIKSRDEIGILSDNLMQVKSILKNLNSDIGELVKTAAAGQMQTRAAVSNYSGDWGLLLKEMNHLLDTLNVPLDYACSIQKNMLPNHTTFKKAFPDYSVIWSPRDIVGGDIYWMKNFSEGSVLCVCDCTGHGTPGALLTMLVMSAFDTVRLRIVAPEITPNKPMSVSVVTPVPILMVSPEISKPPPSNVPANPLVRLPIGVQPLPSLYSSP